MKNQPNIPNWQPIDVEQLPLNVRPFIRAKYGHLHKAWILSSWRNDGFVAYATLVDQFYDVNPVMTSCRAGHKIVICEADKMHNQLCWRLTVYGSVSPIKSIDQFTTPLHFGLDKNTVKIKLNEHSGLQEVQRDVVFYENNRIGKFWPVEPGHAVMYLNHPTDGETGFIRSLRVLTQEIALERAFLTGMASQRSVGQDYVAIYGTLEQMKDLGYYLAGVCIGSLEVEVSTMDDGDELAVVDSLSITVNSN